MTEQLASATDLARKASKPYPNDSAAYREARTALLAEEIELRRHIERVAAQRRALPLGGKVGKNYAFIGEDGRQVGLADLFGPHDTLVTYQWMYGPERKQACPMCTAYLGALDVPSRDISQRVAFVVIGRSPIERQLAFKKERGWRNLKFFQPLGDDFSRDYRSLAPDGDEGPGQDVWVKRGGEVYHFWGAEMSGETADPGEDPRGAPDPTPLWNILDLTPGGRGTDWYPKLSYPDAP